MSIQKLRLKHGWFQQQLAEASGLSVRTIQRIETGYPASTESLKSIAAVFEVDFSTLNPEHIVNPTPTNISMAEHQEAEAFDFVRKLRRFYLHLFRYLIVSTTLLVINLTVIPNKMWVYWVIGAWGLGVLAHASRVFRPDWFLGPQWERERVEKRLGRPL